MKYAMGVAAIFIATSVVAQTPIITAECKKFLTQQLRQGADIDQVLKAEAVPDMADAAWTKCRTAALARLEARRKMAEKVRRAKQQKEQTGGFVEM